METRIIPASAQHLPIYKEYLSPYLALRAMLGRRCYSKVLPIYSGGKQLVRPPKWVRQHLHPRPSDSQAQPFAYGTLLPTTSDTHELSSSSQGTFAYEIIKSLSAARAATPDWLGDVSFPLEHTELLARTSVSRRWCAGLGQPFPVLSLSQPLNLLPITHPE